MRMIAINVLSIIVFISISFSQSRKPIITFDQLFPSSVQNKMGLQKLTAEEKEAFRAYIENLLLIVTGEKSMYDEYKGVGGGHWIQKNVDNGTYIILEDGSLWKIDPLEKIDAMLWLPISNITVVESSSGSQGFDYLLINIDDGEKVHAKYMGQQ